MILSPYTLPTAEYVLGVPMSQVIGNSKDCGVYKITCLTNGKIYIGSAVWLVKRKRDHLEDLRRNKHHNRHLQKAWNKYGEGCFYFSVLEFCRKEQLVDREQYYIDLTNCFNHRIGYNIQKFAYSNLGGIRSAETCKKISLARMGRSFATKEWREELSSKMKGNSFALGMKHSPETINKLKAIRVGRTPALGMVHSIETKSKMSKVRKGRPLSEANKRSISLALSGKKKVKISNETCEMIRKMRGLGVSMTDLSRRFGYCVTTISNILNRSTPAYQ